MFRVNQLTLYMTFCRGPCFAKLQAPKLGCGESAGRFRCVIATFHQYGTERGPGVPCPSKKIGLLAGFVFQPSPPPPGPPFHKGQSVSHTGYMVNRPKSHEALGGFFLSSFPRGYPQNKDIYTLFSTPEKSMAGSRNEGRYHLWVAPVLRTH